MNAIFTILVVLIIIAAVLLTLVVLLQNGKGEGMASNFVAGNQAFGVRQTADILEQEAPAFPSPTDAQAPAAPAQEAPVGE